MKIKEIYELAIKLGRKSDFRSQDQIDSLLKRAKNNYDKLSKEKKEVFDMENLTNPYADSRILVNTDKEIKRIMIGIDMREAELLLADRLGNIDLVISHHPVGIALAGLDEVMELQADVLEQYGVPINVAEGLLKKRISEVARGVSGSNHNRAVDVANLLDMPYMCLHTVCDNLAANYLKTIIEKKNPQYVGELLDFLSEIPEYKEAAKRKAGPKLFAGSKENRCGKIALTEITGGTEGSPEIYERLAQAGIGTVVGMHMSEKHTEAAEKAHINAVIAGHISSDSIGINLFLDEIEKKGIEIVPASGLIRIKRTK
ncbi:NGG1p interacting factor NIF3 [bacterium]|nr:MAG: NGG1p interacting factor NIF3 [bacterium]